MITMDFISKINRKSSRHFILLFIITAISAGNARANQDDNLVVKFLDGDVQYRLTNTDSWVQLAKDSVLSLPLEIKTNLIGEAVLAQGETNFSIQENSYIKLSIEGSLSLRLIDRVKHWFGTVIYKIERNPDEFVVETPFLAATVKGTRFVIVGDENSSIVTLQEGSLHIEDLRSGDTQMMLPGDVVGADSYTNADDIDNVNETSQQAANNATNSQSRLV